jgi:hypothetical protein
MAAGLSDTVMDWANVVEAMDAGAPGLNRPAKYQKRAPTEEEFAKLSKQELYDLFGARYRKNSD